MTRIILLGLFIFIIGLFLSRKKLEEKRKFFSQEEGRSLKNVINNIMF